MAKRKRANVLVKRYLKLIAANPDPSNNQVLLKYAPDEVIKAICNVAYNLTNGEVKIPPKQKALFRKYKGPITKLIQPQASIKGKRRVLVQQGGGFFLPLLISTVLPLIASALFNR